MPKLFDKINLRFFRSIFWQPIAYEGPISAFYNYQSYLQTISSVIKDAAYFLEYFYHNYFEKEVDSSDDSDDKYDKYDKYHLGKLLITSATNIFRLTSFYYNAAQRSFKAMLAVNLIESLAFLSADLVYTYSESANNDDLILSHTSASIGILGHILAQLDQKVNKELAALLVCQKFVFDGNMSNCINLFLTGEEIDLENKKDCAIFNTIATISKNILDGVFNSDFIDKLAIKALDLPDGKVLG